jgi:hypothetical protein
MLLSACRLKLLKEQQAAVSAQTTAAAAAAAEGMNRSRGSRNHLG